MIRVLFLAQLREQLGVASLDVAVDNIKTVGELKSYLLSLNPEWAAYLADAKLLTAINHTYAKENAFLQDGDEVAFFPPVTGG